jgi:hypothetical protein
LLTKFLVVDVHRLDNKGTYDDRRTVFKEYDKYEILGNVESDK